MKPGAISNPEAAAFWIGAILYVAPVWSFLYLPTQDGPAHLNNAQILRDYHDPAAGYSEFFELRGEPLPNLTSHYLLAALLYLVPPWIAEKVLVSLYILGFAGSFRWFLGAFGPRCLPLAWAGLLLVYNRSLWMGFYNFCLSLIFVWVILGCCLRWRGRLSLAHTTVLMLLFTAAYFTHLVGFLVAAAGAIAAAVLASPRRVVDALLIGVAALPAGCLVMNYLEQTGFVHAPEARRLWLEPLARFGGRATEHGIVQQLVEIDDELFAHHVGIASLGSLILLVFWGLLAALTIAGQRDGPAEEGSYPGRLFPVVFGLCLLAGYLLVPSHLGFTHGGFLKTRLAPLPPLIWLACFRVPTERWRRLLWWTTTSVLLTANLVLVLWTIAAGNRALREYTAGLEAAGTGHRLFVIQPDAPRPPLVDPLLHAADYYCLGTDTVNLDNYEASTSHFPVKYRQGVARGRGSLAAYAQRERVDLVLLWQVAPGIGMPADWQEVFHEGRLRLYRRQPP
jgi:hypothetical protein